MVLHALMARESPQAGDPPIISDGSMTAIMWIGVVLSVGFVALRTHIQYRSSGRFFVNDYWIFFALLCHIITAILYQIAIPPMYELAYVSARLRQPGEGFMGRANLFLRLQFALDILLWTTLWSVKFSLLFFFWRLFDSVQSHMRIFWWIMCGVTASTYITSVILQQFACDPISHFFTLGKCSTDHDVYMSNLIFRFSVGTDVAGDVFIMIIPFPLLRKLQISSHQRLVLTIIFLLPIIPILFASLRLALANPTDKNVDPIRFQLYSMLENTTAIVTSCLPSIRLFINTARNNTSASGKGYGSRYGGYFSSGRRGGSSNGPSNRSGSRNFSIRSNGGRDTFGGAVGKGGAIPLETVVETRAGRVSVVGEEDMVGRAVTTSGGDSEEEMILGTKQGLKSGGVMVRKEFSVM